MNASLIRNVISKRKPVIFTAFSLLFMMLGIYLDKLEATINQTGFYFTESFMFSSIWWLFIPFLYIQYTLLQKRKPLPWIVSLAILPAIVHLFVFPAFVWLLSKLFYYHTFRYGQTLGFACTEHLPKLILAYAFMPVYFFLKDSKKIKSAETNTGIRKEYISQLIVSEGMKRLAISVNDIFHFTANPPYINIHLKDKRYLYNGTLKSIEEKLDDQQFVRIHKSTIVNINKVVSYQSRNNGDYDIVMADGNSLRLSRNYTSLFWISFQNRHQVTSV